MRTVINTCIVVLLALLQASETEKVFASERTEVNTDSSASQKASSDGQSCEKQRQDENKETCDVPDVEAEDRQLAETAISVCYPDSQKIPQRYLTNAMKLLKVERELKVPESMRGMTLAAACAESGFNENAQGDHRFSKDGKSPMAIGIFQMWPFYERAFKVNRHDVESSAKGWLTHISHQVSWVQRTCKTKTESDTWHLAWLHGIRGPKKGGRCNESTYHWRLFKKIKNGVLKGNT